MRNIKLTIEFDGTSFFGWQFQPNRPTIQGEIENALKTITGLAFGQAPDFGPRTSDSICPIPRRALHRVKVYGCSRTDAGVSARNYIANFHVESKLSTERFHRALNFHLPKEIHIKSAEQTLPGFHARYSARSKVYLYRMVRGYSPLRHARVWELRYPVDLERMRKALKLLTGRKNFQPFCLTRDASGVCTITRLELTEHKVYGSSRTDDEIHILIQGNRFLYKMVRRIIGAAASYGAARITLADIRAALQGRKHQPFRTAPAAGLLLDSVQY